MKKTGLLLITASVAFAQFDCPGMGWYADPTNCIKYYHCYGDTAERLTCPVADNGQQEYYDPVQNWCNFPEFVDCGDRPICDRNDQNCFSQTTTTEDPNGFHCDQGDGYFADPDNCLKYFHCYGGKPEEHLSCPNGQLWDDYDHYCDYAEKVDCGDRPICDANDQNCVEQTTTTANPICQQGDGYFADPDNCLKFFHCFDGNVEEHKPCPNGQLWDDADKYCDFADRVDCGDRPICDANDQNCHMRTTTTEDPNGFHCQQDGLFPDPNNCIKFYQCVGTTIVAHTTCPKANGEFEAYDESNRWCDFRDRVDCGTRPYCDENDQNCDGSQTTRTTSGGVTTTAAPMSSTSQAPISSTSEAPMSTTTKVPVTTTTHPQTSTSKGSMSACEQATNSCENGDGFYEKGSCEQCYCDCIGSEILEMCCDDGLTWDQSILSCNWPDQVAGCS